MAWVLVYKELVGKPSIHRPEKFVEKKVDLGINNIKQRKTARDKAIGILNKITAKDTRIKEPILLRWEDNILDYIYIVAAPALEY